MVFRFHNHFLKILNRKMLLQQGQTHTMDILYTKNDKFMKINEK